MTKKAMGFGLVGALFVCVMAYLLCFKKIQTHSASFQNGGVVVYRCVQDVVNWRTGPGMKHDIKFVLKNAMHWPIVVEREKDDWVYGRDYLNRSGWIKKKMIQKKLSFLVLDAGVSVYALPRSTSRVKGVLNKNVVGVVLAYAGKHHQWSQVKVVIHKKTLHGWVQSCHIWPKPSMEKTRALS